MLRIEDMFALPSGSDEVDLTLIRNHFAEAVSQDISSHQLIDRKRFPECRSKPASTFPGCIFAGTNKAGRPKAVYVKQYAKQNILGEELSGKFDCLMDYAAFKILKCGRARAPKVRICASKQESGKFNHYLFSTDIAHARQHHQDKSYYFSTLGENSKLKYLAQKGILSARTDLLPDPRPSVDDEQVFKPIAFTYPIDYRSSARLLLLGIIMQLTDLHEENVGFVLSRKDNIVKGKLTFIDFFTQGTPLLMSEDTTSLKEMLIMHYTSHCAADVLGKLVEKIPEEEFVAAFHEILEAGVVNQCSVLTQEVEKMEFASTSMKAQFHNRMRMIEKNIEKLQFFVARKYGNNEKLPALLETKEHSDENRKQSQKCVIC